MFNNEILTPEAAAEIVKNANLISRAFVADVIAQRPFSVQIEVIDLGTAVLETNPKHMRGQFRSVYIQDATDPTAYVNVKIGSRDSVQSAFKMKYNDAFAMSQPQNDLYLHWPAQVGKTLTVVKFTDVEFVSGSQISVSGGGVSINTGTAVTGPTQVALSAVTATIILPVNGNRKQATLQNKTSGSLYIGGSTIGAVGGANEGLEILPGDLFVWTNTGALYGWSVAGGNISYIEEA